MHIYKQPEKTGYIQGIEIPLPFYLQWILRLEQDNEAL